VDNTASVTALPSGPDGAVYTDAEPVTDEDTASSSTSDAAIAVVKTVYAGHDTGAGCPGADSLVVGRDGDVTWCFVITNTGTSRLDNVTLDDPILGIDESDVVVVDGALTGLLPGASVTVAFEATAPSDITNVVDVSGTPVDENGDPLPGVDPPTATDGASVDTVNPGAEIQKTVYSGHDGGALCEGSETVQVAAGNPVTWCFLVTNSGDTRLDNVTFADPALDITSADATLVTDNPTAAGDSTSLAPGESVLWFYEATAGADLKNVANATGTPVDPDGNQIPDTEPPTDEDDASVSISTAGVSIEKTALTPVVLEGEDATFEIVVTNTGEVALSDVKVSDAFGPNCARTIGAMEPGASVTFTCTMTMGSADITNVAVVTGEVESGLCPASMPPGEPCVSDTDDADVELGSADLTFSKVATAEGAVAPGDDVTFEFRLKNTGKSEMTNTKVMDTQFPECDKTIGTVKPGEEQVWECTVSAPLEGDEFTNAAVVESDVLNSSVTLSDADTVAIAPPSLAFADKVVDKARTLVKTGASIEGLLVMGSMLMIGGALLLARRRRRND
jgi:uncharacterized repeat protein (TIGR01451 family)/LPXTG-motif cell wall-anchored protein